MNSVRELNKNKLNDIDTDGSSAPAVDAVPTFEYKITKTQVSAVLKLIQRGYSKRAACAEVGVHRSTFDSAVARISAADQYARALATMAEAQIEQIESTIEDLRSGKITSDMARVELDARKWMASKLLPKKYGDKVEHEGNVNVIFSNGIPRPKYIDGDATSSVPKEIGLSKDPV